MNEVGSPLETIAYLIFQLIDIYLCYCCFEALFKGNAKGKLYVILVFTTRFLAWSTVYLVLDIPLLTLAVNIGTLILASYIYVANWWQRIINSGMIFAFSFVSEALSVFLAGLGQKPDTTALNTSTFLATHAIAKLLMFGVVLYLRHRFHHIIPEKISFRYLVSFLIILIVVGYLAVSIGVSNMPYLSALVSEVALLLLVFIVFHLYEHMQFLQKQALERLSLENQIHCLKTESRLWKENETAIRGLRHDMKNHLLYLEQCEKTGNHEAYSAYMQSLLGTLSTITPSVQTGNLEIDALLNCKLDDARKKKIKIDLQLAIPSNLQLGAMTLNIILGNLLDNAIEAVEKLPSHQRLITIHMKLQHEALHILIENPFQGSLPDPSIHWPKSTKENAAHHGFGLTNVRNVVEKQGGLFKITTHKQLFAAQVLLFLSEIEKKK